MTAFSSSPEQEAIYLAHAEIDLALQLIIDQQSGDNANDALTQRLVGMQIANVEAACTRMRKAGSGVTFETLAHAFAEYTHHRINLRSALADSLAENDA